MAPRKARKLAARKSSAPATSLIPAERIERSIFLIRGQKVMLSAELAALYGIEARILVQAVKRNIRRFPDDFMFQLSQQEHGNLKSQIVISSWGGARRALPYAFTEQGVAMLSSVLRSERAVAVNIEIMRAFVRLRNILATHKDLARRIDDLERQFTRKTRQHEKHVRRIYQIIEALMTPPEPARKPIGFASEIEG